MVLSRYLNLLLVHWNTTIEDIVSVNIKKTHNIVSLVPTYCTWVVRNTIPISETKLKLRLWMSHQNNSEFIRENLFSVLLYFYRSLFYQHSSIFSPETLTNATRDLVSLIPLYVFQFFIMCLVRIVISSRNCSLLAIAMCNDYMLSLKHSFLFHFHTHT